MKLIGMEKTADGKYLKKYNLCYENKVGNIKNYEIVSRNEISDISHLGERVSGVSIVAVKNGKLLLLKEFRMGINREIYNLCAGMLETGESIEECIARELHEETGLELKRIIKILPPSYAAVAISDVLTVIAFVEVTGTLTEKYASENEKLKGNFYDKTEVAALLETEQFSSRAQMAAFAFVNCLFDFLDK